jgi:hypothetical protein
MALVMPDGGGGGFHLLLVPRFSLALPFRLRSWVPSRAQALPELRSPRRDFRPRLTSRPVNFASQL